MGRIFTRRLSGPNVYCCNKCGTHFTTKKDIISKDFHGRKGKAYLFDTAVNVTQGPLEKRMLTTGNHTVADTFCVQCQRNVGWRYEVAFVEAQKYKENKYIFEETLMCLIE